LITERLAGCVNIVPGLASVYPWEGKVEKAQEHLLLIKTETDSFAALEAFIKTRHPYELPEIIAVPVVRGSVDYLEWITAWLHCKS
jgi:periplasmic divalent cation tolerance protein